MSEIPKHIDISAVLARLATRKQQTRVSESKGFQRLPSTNSSPSIPFRTLNGSTGQSDNADGQSRTYSEAIPAPEAISNGEAQPKNDTGTPQRTQTQPRNGTFGILAEFAALEDTLLAHHARFDNSEPTSVRAAFGEFLAARRIARSAKKYARGRQSERINPLKEIRDGLQKEKELAMETFLPKTWRKPRELDADRARREAETTERDIYRGPTLAKTVVLNLLSEHDEHKITIGEAAGALELVVEAILPRDLDLREFDKADARTITADETQTGLNFLAGLLPEDAGEDEKEKIGRVLEAGRGRLDADKRTILPTDYQEAQLVFKALIGKKGEHYRHDPATVIRALSLIKQALPETGTKDKPYKDVAGPFNFMGTLNTLHRINGREDEGISELMDVLDYEWGRLLTLEHQRDNWQQSPLAPLREEAISARDASAEARLRLIDFLFYSSPDPARPDSIRFQAVQDSLTLYMLDQMEETLLYVHKAGNRETTLPEEGKIPERIEQIGKRKELIINQICAKTSEWGFDHTEYYYARNEFDTILKPYLDAQYDHLEQSTRPSRVMTEAEDRACKRRAGEQAITDLVAIDESWHQNIADIGPLRVPGGEGALYMQALQHLTADYDSRSKKEGSVVLGYERLTDLYDGSFSQFDIQMSTDVDYQGRIPNGPEIHIKLTQHNSRYNVMKLIKFNMRLVSRGEYKRLKGGVWGKTRGVLNAANIWDYDYSPKDHAVILYEPDTSGTSISAEDKALLAGIFATFPFKHDDLEGVLL